MNCLGSSRKDEVDQSDRYLTPNRNLRENLVAELRLKLKKCEVKSCENLESLTREKKPSTTIKKSQSLRLEHAPLRVRKTESFFIMSSSSSSTKGSSKDTIFGTSLAENEMDPTNKNVPRILVECCRRIEENLKNSDEVMGIYRVPGEYERIQKIGKRLGRGEFSCLNDVDCVNVISGIVKTFLRETQTPLIKSEDIQQYRGLNRKEWCESTESVKCKSINEFFGTMKPVQRETLKFILKHLKRLCDTYPDKLNSKIFSISIGPAIIHMNKKMSLNVSDSLVECDILNEYLQFMIDNCTEIFRNEADGDNMEKMQIVLETSV